MNTPSMVMEAAEQAAFIKNNLGPAFERASIRTKIFLHIHQLRRARISAFDSPLFTGLTDYVDGSAFHLYGGKIEAMSQVHDTYPNKNLYFSEFMAEDLEHPNRMPVAEPVSGTVIGAVRELNRIVLLWNLAANRSFRTAHERWRLPDLPRRNYDRRQRGPRAIWLTT